MRKMISTLIALFVTTALIFALFPRPEIRQITMNPLMPDITSGVDITIWDSGGWITSRKLEVIEGNDRLEFVDGSQNYKYHYGDWSSLGEHRFRATVCSAYVFCTHRDFFVTFNRNR